MLTAARCAAFRRLRGHVARHRVPPSASARSACWTIGLPILLLGVVLAILGARTPRLNGRASAMLICGLAAAPLLLAWLNRRGPGVVCSTDGTQRCAARSTAHGRSRWCAVVLVATGLFVALRARAPERASRSERTPGRSGWSARTAQGVLLSSPRTSRRPSRSGRAPCPERFAELTRSLQRVLRLGERGGASRLRLVVHETRQGRPWQVAPTAGSLPVRMNRSTALSTQAFPPAYIPWSPSLRTTRSRVPFVPGERGRPGQRSRRIPLCLDHQHGRQPLAGDLRGGDGRPGAR
jgi:hypothetical protein